jgi:outer membrane biogenesis lipoprotein LolB
MTLANPPWRATGPSTSPAVASQLITGCCQPTHHRLLPANSSLAVASQLITGCCQPTHHWGLPANSRDIRPRREKTPPTRTFTSPGRTTRDHATRSF